MHYCGVNMEADNIVAERIEDSTLRDVYILATPGMVIERCRLHNVIIDVSGLTEYDQGVVFRGCFVFAGGRGFGLKLIGGRDSGGTMLGDLAGGKK